MTSIHLRTAALLVMSIALTAAPSYAQRSAPRNGGEDGRREGAQRAQPRAGGESGGRTESQGRVQPRVRVPSQRSVAPRGRVEAQGQIDSRGRVEPRGRVESQRRSVPRGRVEAQGRLDSRGRVESRGRVDSRGQGAPRGRVEPYRGPGNRAYGNRPYDNRSFGNRPNAYRSYGYRSYGYRPYGNRSYVLPYGYRPYGYRPGWSLNLYFGRPYAHGYSTYGYPASSYGYYAIVPGRAYGALRIVDAPPDAHVFVDGYYAGVVDDYDGVFQHLNLEAGPHHIEIEEQGYPPIAFEVRVEPGRTITYRANIR